MDQEKKQNNLSDLIGEFSVPMSLLVVCQQEKDRFRQNLIELSGVIGEDVLDIYPNADGKKDIVTIKQSRELIHWLSLKPQAKIKIAFVHNADLLNSEAANALLKIIEEMPKHAAIVLFTPHINIISTIKSRCRVIRIAEQNVIENKHKKYISAFITQSFAKQSKSIDEIVNSGKTNIFLRSLEEWAGEEMLNKKSSENIKNLEKIFLTKRSIASNANAKLALENLVLSFRK